MPTPDMEAITQFSDVGLSDIHLRDQCCIELAKRYRYLFDSFLPWTEAVYKAQPSYPGLSQGKIAHRWLSLDNQALLAVSLSRTHDLLVSELA